MSALTDEKAREMYNQMLNYTYSEIQARMVAYGEDFNLALQNVIKDKKEDTPIGGSPASL